MPTPPAPGPDEPCALSPREQAILAGIEEDLNASAPDLAREMARPMAAGTAPPGLVHGGLVLLVLLVVMAVAGLMPAALLAVVAVLGAMVLVPWLLLTAFERLDRD